jgi:hypothetical protein
VATKHIPPVVATLVYFFIVHIFEFEIRLESTHTKRTFINNNNNNNNNNFKLCEVILPGP